MDYTMAHWGDIRKGVGEGAAQLSAAANLAWKHKEAGAAAFATYAAGPYIVQMGDAALQAGAALRAFAVRELAILTGGVAANTGTWWKANAAMLSTIGAMASMAWAMHEYTELQKAGGAALALHFFRGGKDTKADTEAFGAAMAREMMAGREGTAMQMMQDKQQKVTDLRKFGNNDEKADANVWQTSINEWHKQFTAMQEIQALSMDAAKEGSGDKLVAMYNQAESNKNLVVMTAIAKRASGSQAVYDALTKAGEDIAGGMDGMVRLLGKGAREALQSMIKHDYSKDVSGGEGSAEAAANKPGSGNISMSGGQTFNIKQEYRDSDPDRIAMVFKRDLVRAIESRRSAGVVSPFGAR
jgi:hypothetical protein